MVSISHQMAMRTRGKEYPNHVILVMWNIQMLLSNARSQDQITQPLKYLAGLT